MTQTTEELKNELKSIKVGGNISVEENDKRWARIFEIEAELRKRDELTPAFYSED